MSFREYDYIQVQLSRYERAIDIINKYAVQRWEFVSAISGYPEPDLLIFRQEK